MTVSQRGTRNEIRLCSRSARALLKQTCQTTKLTGTAMTGRDDGLRFILRSGPRPRRLRPPPVRPQLSWQSWHRLPGAGRGLVRQGSSQDTSKSSQKQQKGARTSDRGDPRSRELGPERATSFSDDAPDRRRTGLRTKTAQTAKNANRETENTPRVQGPAAGYTLSF